MPRLPLVLAIGLLALAVPFVPTAAAFDCDGDPMYWNRDYPTYHACEVAEPWVNCVTRSGPCPQ